VAGRTGLCDGWRRACSVQPRSGRKKPLREPSAARCRGAAIGLRTPKHRLSGQPGSQVDGPAVCKYLRRASRCLQTWCEGTGWVPRGNNVPLGLLIEASNCAIINLFNHPNKSLNTDCGGIMVKTTPCVPFSQRSGAPYHPAQRPVALPRTGPQDHMHRDKGKSDKGKSRCV
jgi:hypothetical protein